MKRIGICAAVIVVAAVAALVIMPGRLIRTAVEKGGSFALHVPVRVKGAGVRLLSGVIDLRGFEVSNPEGYRTKNAVEVGHINVCAPLVGLMGRKPRIESITVEDPAVTLEQGLTSSNLADLMGNVGKTAGKDTGKKIIIGKLRLVGARVTLSAKMPGALPVTINLPAIEMRELGGEGGSGVTIAQTVGIALKELVQAAVANGGGMIPPEIGKSLSSSIASVDQAGRQILGAAAGAGGQAVTAAGSAAGKLLEGAKSLGGSR